MNLKELGIDTNRGGCTMVCVGQLIKNEPWSFTDKESGEYKEGHAFQVAYFGGVLKVATDENDPLRKLTVGASLELLVPVADAGRGMRQAGTATVISNTKINEGKAA